MDVEALPALSQATPPHARAAALPLVPTPEPLVNPPAVTLALAVLGVNGLTPKRPAPPGRVLTSQPTIGGVTPSPVTVNVYGFSSASSLAIVMVAVLLGAIEVGEKVIVKVVELLAATVAGPAALVTVNSAALAPLFATMLGVPVKFKVANPVFFNRKCNCSRRTSGCNGTKIVIACSACNVGSCLF